MDRKFSSKALATALAEYSAIVDCVAEVYDDQVTVEDIRADHPELDFMDDDEIQYILRSAKTARQKKSDFSLSGWDIP